MSTIDFLFIDQNGPFLVAMAVTLMIALLEVLGLVLGFGLSDLIDDLLPDFGPEVDLDVDVDLDADIDAEAMDVTHTNIFGQALGWLNVGRVPFLVLLITFLTSFAVIGLVAQSLAATVIGLVPAIIAGPAAAVAALPVTRQASRLLARIVPREETYAVSEGLFVGEIAKVTMGPVESANPGKAKVTDAHGNIHFLRVRSANPSERFELGSEVLLVRHDGPVFEVIAAPDSLARAR